MVYHFVCHAGVNAYPEGIVHNIIGVFKAARYAVALSRFAHFVKAGVLYQVAAEQKARLHICVLDFANNLFARKAAVFS